jgi:hypothetical protein
MPLGKQLGTSFKRSLKGITRKLPSELLARLRATADSAFWVVRRNTEQDRNEDQDPRPPRAR